MRTIRLEVFGPDGVDVIATRLDISAQTWRNIEEIGGLISAAQLLAFIELTGASPLWLLRGQGPKYRPIRETGGNTPPESE
ncbi:MAG: hypothetical protein P4L84_35930 [Isosphaeraceae bacterium]|nr:hypothetical protein [Isosphaeraceae bacterium]